ncbi:MAG: hypothetical protein ABIR96_12470 [Bdellovibrionota bacterium]
MKRFRSANFFVVGFVLLLAAIFFLISKKNPVDSSAESAPHSNEEPKAARTLEVKRLPGPATDNDRVSPSTTEPAKILSPQEEVASWGKPLFEGNVRIDASRVAHQKIYRTKLKYPLIMVQQMWNATGGDLRPEDYIGERKMVADHFMVRLRDTQDFSQFEQIVEGRGMSVRKQMYANGLYLVSFPLEGVDTFQKIQKQLSEMPEVRSVTPDIFGRGF